MRARTRLRRRSQTPRGAPPRRSGHAERRLREEALQASEERYRSLYTRTPVMMHSIDRDGRLISVSDHWLKTLGYERAEVIGRRLIDFLTPHSRRYATEEVLPAFFQTGSSENVPYQFVKKNGETIDLLLSATSERDAENRVTRSLAVLIDVTARNRAEEEVRHLTADLEERVRLRTADLAIHSAVLLAQQETSLDGILVVGPKRSILSHNSRFAQMWGIPAQVLAARSDEAALRAALPKLQDPHSFLARVNHLYAHPDEQGFDELLLRDGRTFERYTSPVFGGGRVYYGRVWYFRDVTERKRSEAALREKNEALARSNADLEAYASAASHDLAAPVNKMIAFAELLKNSAGGKLNANELAWVDRILGNGRRMATLINDILKLSRVGRDSAPKESVPLNRAVSEALADLELAIMSSRAVVVAGPLPTVRAYPALLRELFQNLISNALKFRATERTPRVEIGSRPAPDGGIEVWVRDNGVGFEKRFAKKIFEPFVRLHRPGEYEGTGIGLAICRRIAERHGGRIWATSAPGEGSTVTLWLPATAIESPESERPEP